MRFADTSISRTVIMVFSISQPFEVFSPIVELILVFMIDCFLTLRVWNKV